MSKSSLEVNIESVQRALVQAALRSGRPAPKLVAATKQVPLPVIERAAASGLSCFGENRVQEALIKTRALPGLEWHFIGRLQTNKVKDAVGAFSLIQSLDRFKLAEAIEEQAAGAGRQVNVLVQVNIAGEPQKGGVAPAELEDFLLAVARLSHLRVQGLMAVPPYTDNPEEVRPYFRQMHQLFQACRVPGTSMKYLSMGMSDDYTVAVEEGANLVRIGSAIFGARN